MGQRSHIKMQTHQQQQQRHLLHTSSSTSWGVVQQNQPQQQQLNVSPYMDYASLLQMKRPPNMLAHRVTATTTTSASLMPKINYKSAAALANGNYTAGQEERDIGYLFSNSGKKFEYGLQESHHHRPHNRPVQNNYTTTTHQITMKNRSTYLNDLEIIERDYFFTMVTTMRGGFCGALQRLPPPLPKRLHRDRGSTGNFGKIKVMLRMTDNNHSAGGGNEFIRIDEKKRQITFLEAPLSSSAQECEESATTAAGAATTPVAGPSSSTDRAPMVSAPKIFAFDGLFTTSDTQNDVCAAALQDVIPAVLDGIDGCVLALGHPKSGQSRSMFGSMTSGDMGVIPCAIAWLYKCIADHRERFGSRFSVRMSALAVSGSKPGSSKAHDLLASMASEADDSPGMYLNVGGPVELRAPTMERAALYLDMALSQISNHAYAPATVFTLHVYQYNLEQGKLSGGRSRLHLISLGDAANSKAGLPLSGVGNVLLAVLGGQKHVPHKSHPLTIILRECLASFSSNISVITHLSYAQNRTDALTIIQLSSRIHRIRRKKNKYHPARAGALQLNSNGGHLNVGSSSSGLEPSSSEMSADTVIYLGPCPNEETDGEHPPVVLPNLSYNGNQCTVDVPENYPKPQAPPRKMSSSTPNSPRMVAAIKPEKIHQPVVTVPPPVAQHHQSHPHHPHAAAGHSRSRVEGVHKAANHSPHHHPQQMHSNAHHHHRQAPRGMIHADSIVMEQWVDGPRVARSKISEARHLKREVNRNKNSETWIDGPRMEPKVEPKPQPQVQHQNQPALPQLPTLASKQRGGYGFMDTHKKTMIRKWVENQTTEVLKISTNASVAEWQAASAAAVAEEVVSPSPRRSSCSRGTKTPSADEDDQDSGPSDIPPALPLIDKSSSKNSEKDYGYTMNPTVHTESGCQDPLASHPLSALSYGNMSTVSSFHFEEVRIQSDQRRNTNDKNLDQLARIRELFTSQLALAEVNRVFHFCTNDNNSIFSEPVHKVVDGGDLDSLTSEPMMLYNNPQNFRRDSNPAQRPTDLDTNPPMVSVGLANLQEGAAAAAAAAASNLQDLDLEYPFVNQQQQPASSRGFAAEIQEELARIIPQPGGVEPYDSGHDSTPRTSKHSGFSRRAESGYHSISVTVHDESEVSSLKSTAVSTPQTAKRDRRLLCLWLRNPFNCTTQAETEAEISDF